MRIQIKFQKIVCLVLLAVCAFAFFTSLGLNTNFYEVLKPFSKEDGEPIVDGANLFYDIQGFNKQLNSIAVIGVLFAVSLFITKSDSRRKYFITNYIFSFATSIFLIASSVWSMISTGFYRTQFLNSVDWEYMQELIDTREKYKSFVADKSTFFLDLNIVANLLVIIVSLLLISSVVWKIVETDKEKKLLRPLNSMEANQ